MSPSFIFETSSCCMSWISIALMIDAHSNFTDFNLKQFKHFDDMPGSVCSGMSQGVVYKIYHIPYQSRSTSILVPFNGFVLLCKISHLCLPMSGLFSLQNELAILEFIHNIVETFDRYFNNVVRTEWVPLLLVFIWGMLSWCGRDLQQSSGSLSRLLAVKGFHEVVVQCCSSLQLLHCWFMKVHQLPCKFALSPFFCHLQCELDVSSSNTCSLS